VARIRTVKPELFKHEDLFELEQETGLPIRLAFVGLFTCCDREGRFKWRPRALKLDVLPYDMCDFSRVLDALITRGFVRKYTVNGEEYGVIPTFAKHQIINNREAESELPSPEEDQGKSTTSTREPRVSDASTTPHEGKGREGKGKEEEGKGRELSVERRGATPDRDVVAEVFAYWQKTMDAPRAQLDAKRGKAIKDALKLYDPRQVCEAILGCSRSAWHMGENDRRQKFNGLGLILRDAEHIDKFIELASKRTTGPESIDERNARILADLMREDGQAPADADVFDVDMTEVADAT